MLLLQPIYSRSAVEVQTKAISTAAAVELRIERIRCDFSIIWYISGFQWGRYADNQSEKWIFRTLWVIDYTCGDIVVTPRDIIGCCVDAPINSMTLPLCCHVIEICGSKIQQNPKTGDPVRVSLWDLDWDLIFGIEWDRFSNHWNDFGKKSKNWISGDAVRPFWGHSIQNTLN